MPGAGADGAGPRGRVECRWSRTLTILLVEQNADASLGSADYVYVMHEGVIKAEGTPEEIKKSDEIREACLGI